MNKLVLIPILSLCLLLSGIESLGNYQGLTYSTSNTDPRANTDPRVNTDPTSNTDPRGIQPKYTFESLGQLALRDIIRWAYILEDLTSEVLQRQFFEGIVDKKTIKLGIRFLVQKLYNVLREQNVIPDEFSHVQFLWPPPSSPFSSSSWRRFSSKKKKKFQELNWKLSFPPFHDLLPHVANHHLISFLFLFHLSLCLLSFLLFFCSIISYLQNCNRFLLFPETFFCFNLKVIKTEKGRRWKKWKTEWKKKTERD